MRSIDWQDIENYRNKLLAELIEWCVDHGLNSEANEKRIIIQLPTVQEMSVWPEHKKRKVFNWDALPSNGEIEGMPDELPPTTTPLEEGEAPKGYNEDEELGK